ncbi:MAG TPA: CoA-binding protein [Candidatus Kapabacteria bacterium]|nr:CoA-binding protein [Candidatus Kapabacteria bacterium]
MKSLLQTAKNIAVVGASTKPWRDSNGIMEYLLKEGYNVIPVNPSYDAVLGKKCYPDLKSIPEVIDIVDIFRNPAEVMPIIDEAIAIHAKAVWMQLTVVNEEAKKKAQDAGLAVVMDHCILIEHRRLFHWSR